MTGGQVNVHGANEQRREWVQEMDPHLEGLRRARGCICLGGVGIAPDVVLMISDRSPSELPKARIGSRPTVCAAERAYARTRRRFDRVRSRSTVSRHAPGSGFIALLVDLSTRFAGLPASQVDAEVERQAAIRLSFRSHLAVLSRSQEAGVRAQHRRLTKRFIDAGNLPVASMASNGRSSRRG